jgi:hypothetical protein
MWRSAIFCTLLISIPAFAQTEASGMKPISCKQEADCLANLTVKAHREGDVLTLRLEGGKTKAFKTNRQACENDNANDCIVYELRAYRPAQNVYVVAWTLYEGKGAGLISTKTGDVLVLPDMPDFSPSGQWFVAVDNDPHYTPEFQVGIWSLQGGAAKQEFRYGTPQDISPEGWNVLGWDGDKRIRFEVGGLDDDSVPKVETDAVLREQGWLLNWPLSKSK